MWLMSYCQKNINYKGPIENIDILIKNKIFEKADNSIFINF